MENLLTLCDRAVEAALKAGADEAEAMSVRMRDVNVELQKNDLQIARSMSGDGLGLRVFKGGSLGFCVREQLRRRRASRSRSSGLSGSPPRLPATNTTFCPIRRPSNRSRGSSTSRRTRSVLSAPWSGRSPMLRAARGFDPQGDRRLRRARGPDAARRPSSTSQGRAGRPSAAASSTATSSGWPRRARPSRRSTSSSTAPARPPASTPSRWRAGLPRTSSVRSAP